MKKFIFNTALMLFAIMAFCSCEDNNDRLTVYYNITLSDDMTQIADLAVTYKGENGVTMTDTITSGKVWEKKVHLDTFPCQFGIVDYAFIPKPADKLKKETYRPSAELNIYVRKGKFSLASALIYPFTLKRDRVATFLDVANDHGDLGALTTAIKGKDGFEYEGQDIPDSWYPMEHHYKETCIADTTDAETDTIVTE